MEKIWQFIRDPAWWFTVVFIALIVSVLGGFLKERVEIVFASVSKTYRSKKQKREKKRVREVERLVNDGTFFIIRSIRFVAGTIISLLTCVLYFSIANFPPDIINRNISTLTRMGIWLFIITTVLMILATPFIFWIVYRLKHEAELLWMAYKTYKEEEDITREKGVESRG